MIQGACNLFVMLTLSDERGETRVALGIEQTKPGKMPLGPELLGSSREQEQTRGAPRQLLDEKEP